MSNASTSKGAVVVTGATGGIGSATSRALKDLGFRVFGSHLPSESRAPLDELGIDAFALDITDVASVDRARDEVLRSLGHTPLAGLVNNAGIADGGPVEMTDLDALRRMLDVNVFGMFAVTKAFLPSIRAAKGRIINVSSQSGHLAVPFLSAYCACKFAVEAFSDSLRREMLPFGVEVVVIQPAVTRTPIWDRAADIDLERFRGTPYEKAAETIKKRMLKSQRKGLDPALVGAAIARALTEPRPPTRIPVLKKGKLAKYYLSAWLPDRIIDRLVAKELSKEPKPVAAAGEHAQARG
jgi:NAD(P)-dependent dehydrogenase (short-subunit alcohol dehydrogenase family)